MFEPLKTIHFSLAVFGILLPGLGRAEQAAEIRAARSVHLSYPAAAGTLFYNEVVVDESVNGSYFMACGWNTGYFGIQQLDAPEDKVVIFSVWDPTQGDDPNGVKPEERVEVLYQDHDARIKRFGGEGTGGQCLFRYQWALGQTNRFLIASRISGQKTAYTAWVQANGQWKKLATFRTRTGGQSLSGYYSFIEDFRRDGKSAQESRRARFGSGRVKLTNGEWVPLLHARFTASGSAWESKENIDAGTKDEFFYLATGGDNRRTRELRTMIDLPESAGKTLKPKDLPAEAADH